MNRRVRFRTHGVKEIRTYPKIKRWELYDQNGKNVNAVWGRTYDERLFYLPFQWDAAQIARLIDPETAWMRIAFDWNEGEEPEYDDERIYLVLKIRHAMNVGKPILKDAPRALKNCWL